MKRTPAILILDVGKTNKKAIVFDETYKLIHESVSTLTESKDEDGFPCEDIDSLRGWATRTARDICGRNEFYIQAINTAAYGATIVCLDEKFNVVLPICNYLKPYPDALLEKFYNSYGGKNKLTADTASPALGNLNSGLQLYRLRHEQPGQFARIRYAVHLPQYVSYLLTGKLFSDITSIGCHTHLWDFPRNTYHGWVKAEKLDEKFPPIATHHQHTEIDLNGNNVRVGIGLHDSSAALIPYQTTIRDPFLLISTGTWAISLNPFNHSPLSQEELANDCLCYLSYQGKPVKASRFAIGFQYDRLVAKIAEHFHTTTADFINRDSGDPLNTDVVYFDENNLGSYADVNDAYRAMMADLVNKQTASCHFVLKDSPVKQIFVDGGFGKNSLYMQLLSEKMPRYKICAASMSQATALGAALAMHHSWNKNDIPKDMIQLKYYTPRSRTYDFNN